MWILCFKQIVIYQKKLLITYPLLKWMWISGTVDWNPKQTKPQYYSRSYLPVSKTKKSQDNFSSFFLSTLKKILHTLGKENKKGHTSDYLHLLLSHFMFPQIVQPTRIPYLDKLTENKYKNKQIYLEISFLMFLIFTKFYYIYWCSHYIWYSYKLP